jgi:cell division protein FtsL
MNGYRDAITLLILALLWIVIIIYLAGCVSMSYHQRLLKEAREEKVDVEENIDMPLCDCGQRHITYK